MNQLGRIVAVAPKIIWLISLAAMAGSASAQPISKPPPVASAPLKILTVGNSFTRNATRFLGDLAEAGGHQLKHESLIIGGSSLERHANKARAYEENPNDPEGRYANGMSLQQALQDDDWNYVTIQQLSIKSHDLESYRPHARQLAEIIRRLAPNAQLLVHQTWAYRKDDPRFSRPSKDAGEPRNHGEPRNQGEMYRGLNEAYRTISRQLDGRRIPVGDAFFLADNDPRRQFTVDTEFDTETASHPALPDQANSLHVGWRWQKREGEWKLRFDGHHANVAGEYLGACVWYEVLFGEDVVGNRFVPEALDAEHARFLQQTAHRAVTYAKEKPRRIDSQVVPFDDPKPQRYVLQSRASVVDPRTREYPEIDFVFEKDGKPQDLQYASVDTRVPAQGKLVIWLMSPNDALFQRLNQHGLHAMQVSYARQWFGILCQPRPKDGQARGNVRLEAATGEDFSDELDLAKPDGMSERARQFVRWLHRNNPQGRQVRRAANGGPGLLPEVSVS